MCDIDIVIACRELQILRLNISIPYQSPMDSCRRLSHSRRASSVQALPCQLEQVLTAIMSIC